MKQTQGWDIVVFVKSLIRAGFLASTKPQCNIFEPLLVKKIAEKAGFFLERKIR